MHAVRKHPPSVHHRLLLYGTRPVRTTIWRSAEFLSPSQRQAGSAETAQGMRKALWWLVLESRLVLGASFVALGDPAVHVQRRI
jgi:hypothetical protein